MTPATWVSLRDEIGRAEAGALASGVRPPVALTGATGFVGSHLAEALVLAGLEVRVHVRDPRRLPATVLERVRVIRGDLTDRASLETLVEGAGTVLHVAGLVRSASSAAFDRVNRLATAELAACTATLSPGALFVLVSTLAALGPSQTPGGLDVSAVPRPISAYGRSKLGGEEAVSRTAVRWAIVRPPAVYGPRDVDVLQFFRLAALGVVPLPRGKRWVTVAHVSDVVRGVLAVAGRGEHGRVYHLGEPEAWEMRALVAAIAREGGVAARVMPVPESLVRLLGVGGDCLRALGLSSVSLTRDKSRELVARHWTARTADSLRGLGLTGFVPFADGARSTWAWYRAQGWVPRAKIRAA